MTALGSLQPSALGMAGHSRALATIGANIANLSTTGYKQTDTEFKTLLSGRWAPAAASASAPVNSHADLGGVRSVDYARIATQGQIAGTGRDFDLAIAGPGFFVLDSALGGGGERLFSRDGAFSVAVNDGRGYLVDANGHYVLGYAVAEGGARPAGGQPAAMRVDADAFTDPGQATGSAALALNLPAGAAPGSIFSRRLEIYDAAAQPRALDLRFTKAEQANTWTWSLTGTAGETIAIDPPAPGGGAGEGDPLRFDARGAPIGPAVYGVVADAGAGAPFAFSLDLGALTQYAGDFVVDRVSQDGAGPGRLASLAFAAGGDLVGSFDNGRSRPLYTLALADFANPDGLAGRNGTLFAVTERSGRPTYGPAGGNGLGTVTPRALELSTVDLEEQFSRMILTQNAYNSSATAFRTVDEMTETARDLKRA